MVLILFFNAVFFVLRPAQHPVDQVEDEKLFTVSEVNIKPEPIEGMAHFHVKWSKKVIYPEKAIAEKIQGMVFVEFVVNKDGTIAHAGIKSGIGHGCDEAALKGFGEVTKERWKSAVKNGVPVNVKMVLPFFFRIIEKN